MFSAKPHAPSSFIKYEFTLDAFNGPMNDGLGRAAYTLSSPETFLGGMTSTQISHPDGQVVGMIEWPGVLRSKKITLDGVQVDHLLYQKSVAWVGPTKHSWKDSQDNEFYWKESTVRFYV